MEAVLIAAAIVVPLYIIAIVAAVLFARSDVKMVAEARFDRHANEAISIVNPK